jgi:hypothetical protein
MAGKQVVLEEAQVVEMAGRFRALYEKHFGDMYQMGKELGYSTRQMYKFLGQYPVLKQAFMESEENTIEAARATMRKGALNVEGYGKALPNTMFFLKAKDNWSDRMTVVAEGGFVVPTAESASSLEEDRPALTLVRKIEPGASK